MKSMSSGRGVSANKKIAIGTANLPLEDTSFINDMAFFLEFSETELVMSLPKIHPSISPNAEPRPPKNAISIGLMFGSLETIRNITAVYGMGIITLIAPIKLSIKKIKPLNVGGRFKRKFLISLNLTYINMLTIIIITIPDIVSILLLVICSLYSKFYSSLNIFLNSNGCRFLITANFLRPR